MSESKPTLAERVTEVEASVEVIGEKVDELMRAVYGHNSTPGMLSEQKNLCEKMDDLKKMMWIIITICAGIAIEGVYLAVQHVLSGG